MVPLGRDERKVAESHDVGWPCWVVGRWDWREGRLSGRDGVRQWEAASWDAQVLSYPQWMVKVRR